MFQVSDERGRRRLTTVIGAAVLATVALVFALAYFKPDPFSHRFTVRAMFADSSGLGVVGEDVRMAGVPVGKVVGRERSGNHALVTMEIDPDAAPIHADASAELRPHLAFEGTAYIDIDPGSPSAPPLGDAPIPLSRTRSYVPLDEALRVFQRPTRRATKATAGDLAETLRGQGVAGIKRTLDGAPGLARTLAQAAGAARGAHGIELAAAVEGLSQTANGIAARSSQLEPLLRGADRTLAAVDTGGGTALDRSLQALPGALADLDSGGRALDGILVRLDPLARALDPGLEALGPTLDAATPLVHEAGPVLSAATPLASDFRRALNAGAHATPEARRLLGTADPSLRLLNGSLLPALHARTPELHIPAYLAFLNLFEGGGGASRPFQTAAQGTPGHFMRFGLRFLSGVGYPLPPCTLLTKASPQLGQRLSGLGLCTP